MLLAEIESTSRSLWRSTVRGLRQRQEQQRGDGAGECSAQHFVWECAPAAEPASGHLASHSYHPDNDYHDARLMIFINLTIDDEYYSKLVCKSQK